MSTPRAIFVWIRDFANRPTARLCFGYVPLYYVERRLSEYVLSDADFDAIRAHSDPADDSYHKAIDALIKRYPPPSQPETAT